MIASAMMLFGERQAAKEEIFAAINTVKEALRESDRAQDNQLIAAGR